MDLIDDYKKLYKLYDKFGRDEDLNVVFYSINQPIPYKDLLIYPVKVVYWLFFHSFIECFFVSKYDSKLPECIGMDPLQFLFYQNAEKGIYNASKYLPLLEQLLLMCLKKEEVQDDQTSTIKFINDPESKKCFIRIEGKDYDWKDFVKIRDIICEQNCVELPDYHIHADIRKKLREKDELLSRTNKQKIASFEELIDCLIISTGFSEEHILSLSIRRFTNLLFRYGIMKEYDLRTILSPNMEKKNLENIPKWYMAKPKQDQYFSKVTNLAEVERKINGMNK